MAKELPYFKFIISEWNDGDVTLCSFQAQGLFINLCSLYWSQEGKLSWSKCKKRFSACPENVFDELVSEKIVKVKSDIVTIKFLDEQFSERKKLCSNNAKNGALGGRPKTKTETKADANRTVIGSETETKANETNIEKKREEKRREEERRRESGDKSPARALGERKDEFYKLLAPEVNNYSKKMLRHFYDYWTEHSQNGKKMRFEKEKVFDVKKRLATWARREGVEPAEDKKADYSNAEIDRKNLTIKAWEETYSYYLETDNNFRKHFNYDELPESSAVGSHY